MCGYLQCTKKSTHKAFIYGRDRNMKPDKDKFIRVYTCDEHKSHKDLWDVQPMDKWEEEDYGR